MGEWVSGEIKITHCDHNLHSSKLDQLSGLCSPVPTMGIIRVLTLIIFGTITRLNKILIVNKFYLMFFFLFFCVSCQMMYFYLFVNLVFL